MNGKGKRKSEQKKKKGSALLKFLFLTLTHQDKTNIGTTSKTPFLKNNNNNIWWVNCSSRQLARQTEVLGTKENENVTQKRHLD